MKPAMPDVWALRPDEDPNQAYRILMEHYPLAFSERAGCYVITRHEDVTRGFADKKFSAKPLTEAASAFLGGPPLTDIEGKALAARRRPITSFFAGEQRERIKRILERNARELVAGWVGEGHVELVQQFCAPFAVMSFLDVLDLPREDLALFLSWYRRLVAAFADMTNDAQIRQGGIDAGREMRDYLDPIVRRRQASPGEDLLSRLCVAPAEAGGTLPLADVKLLTVEMLFGSGEGTEKTLASTMMNLVDHPDQLARVRADRSFIPHAVGETLRYTPMVNFEIFEAREDIELSGGRLPAGSRVTLVIGAANRDPALFKRPDEFDLFRPEIDPHKEYTASACHRTFGGGRHVCPGALFFKDEAEAAFNALLDGMDDIHYPEGWKPTLAGIWVRGVRSLELTFTPGQAVTVGLQPALRPAS